MADDDYAPPTPKRRAEDGPIHGVQWTLLIAFLVFLAAFLYSMLGPLREWADFGVVYTPQGLADLMQAFVYGLGAALLALGVDVRTFVSKALGR